MRRPALWWVGLVLIVVSAIALTYYLCQLPPESIEVSRKYSGPATLTGMSKHLHIAVNVLLLSVIAFVGVEAMRKNKTSPPQE